VNKDKIRNGAKPSTLHTDYEVMTRKFGTKLGA